MTKRIASAKELNQILIRVAGENRTVQLHHRIRPATKEMLAALAKWHGMSETKVVDELIHQAYSDLAQDGEVLALMQD